MNKKIILYVVLGILIIGLLVFTFFPNIGYAIRDSGKAGSEDICQPPAGTTLAEWQTHMSHHPNIYSKCLS